MRRFIAVGSALALALVFSSSASAGVYANDLGKCLVRKTSEADRADLMRWLFGAMSMNPAIRSITNLTAEQRDQYAKAGGELIERLLLVDCRSETAEGMKYEGSEVIGGAFKVLGEVAVVGLMSHPAVDEELEKVAKFLNQSKWDAFTEEYDLTKKLGPEAKN